MALIKRIIIKKNVLPVLTGLLLISFLFSCNKSDTIKPIEYEPITIKSENPVNIGKEKKLITLSTTDEIIITCRNDYPPLMFVNENEFTGFFPEVEKAILKELGQRYRFVPIIDVSKTMLDIKTGAVHAGLGAVVCNALKKICHFSKVIGSFDALLYVHEDNVDICGSTYDEMIKCLYGKRVGMQARGVILDMLSPYKEITIVEYSTCTKAVEQLAFKQVDAVPEIKPVADYLIKTNGWKLKTTGVPFTKDSEWVTVFCPDLDPGYIDRYNKALDKLKSNGTFDHIYRKWLTDDL